jgi:long-chain acyl-CoA synthetase
MVARTLARLAKQVEMALGGSDLSLSQYRVLVFLSEFDAAAASALATRLDVSRPSVTALVDGLEARGLVERHPSANDRRRVEHHLTVDGKRALATADRAIGERLDILVGRLDDDQAEPAVTGIEIWGDALGRARAAYLANEGPKRRPTETAPTSASTASTGQAAPAS